MTASYGITSTVIEQYTGITFTDMMIDGEPMTAAQWDTFCTTYVEVVAQIVHRYCNVPTFDPAQPEAVITEYRSGKQPSDDWDYPNQYLAQDYRFYLLWPYYSTPAIAVYEDVGGKTAPPEWVLRKSRLSGATPEVDTILITNGVTTSGTLVLTINNTTTVNVAVTAGQTIAQVCAAIVAAGAQTDGSGYVWTPTTDGVEYVYWTCNTAAAVNMVQVNVASTGVVANAYVQTSGSAGSGGDYEVITKGEVTVVSFYNNIPASGENNVKLVYYTGFDPTGKPYQDIKYQIQKVFKGLILSKKNIQAVLTITANGGRDFQGLTTTYSDEEVLAHMDRSILRKYKRTFYPGGTMTD